MHDLNEFLKSYVAVVVGLVLLLIGTAGVGMFLTFAGEGASISAIVLGAIAAVGLASGLGLLVVVFHRRGGLLRGPLTRNERIEYRGGQRQVNVGSSSTRQV